MPLLFESARSVVAVGAFVAGSNMTPAGCPPCTLPSPSRRSAFAGAPRYGRRDVGTMREVPAEHAASDRARGAGIDAAMRTGGWPAGKSRRICRESTRAMCPWPVSENRRSLLCSARSRAQTPSRHTRRDSRFSNQTRGRRSWRARRCLTHFCWVGGPPKGRRAAVAARDGTRARPVRRSAVAIES